jgi:hypothetical protein
VRAWFVFVPADRLRMISGEQAMADYQWTPPGRPAPHLHYRFCKTCGVRAFARGNSPDLGGEFYAVAIAALDDVPAQELVGKIKCVDGRNGRYDRAPDDTRLM